MKTKYLNKTVNAFKVLILVVAVVLSGCADLEEDPTLALLSPGEYSNLTEMEIAVTGMYRSMVRGNSSQGMNFTAFYMAAYGGDDISTHKASNKAELRQCDQRNVTPFNGTLKNAWITSYKTIRSANNILFNSVNLPESEQKDLYLGEAYFIRGFLYHHLTRIWGKIPMQLEPTPILDLPLSEILDVYKQIESDWLAAESLLPMIYPGVLDGAPRPNSGSARAFLSRLYLDWAGFPNKDASKYAMAASSAKQVIDNHVAHGFDLVADLDDLWSIEHRFNKESIYTAVFCVVCGTGNRKTGKLGNPGGFPLGGWQQTFGEIRFFEDFPPGHRKDATYITDPLIADPFNPATDPNGPTINWTAIKDQQVPIIAKITGKGDISRPNSNNDRNDYTMRYAEVLLIYAEASARDGNKPADAWEALNKIKRRAELLPPDLPDAGVDVTSGDLAELAYTEKKWELAGEWLRWFDLIRMERVAEALDNDYRNNTTSIGTDPDNPNFGQIIIEHNQILGSTGTDNYFAPIPQSEIDLNPNLGGGSN